MFLENDGTHHAQTTKRAASPILGHFRIPPPCPYRQNVTIDIVRNIADNTHAVKYAIHESSEGPAKEEEQREDKKK